MDGAVAGDHPGSLRRKVSPRWLVTLPPASVTNRIPAAASTAAIRIPSSPRTARMRPIRNRGPSSRAGGCPATLVRTLAQVGGVGDSVDVAVIREPGGDQAVGQGGLPETAIGLLPEKAPPPSLAVNSSPLITSITAAATGT